MSVTYYKIPLRLSGLKTNVSFKTVSLEESIIQYIHLIMTTRFGECQFDQSLGCALWDVDFNNMTSDNKLRTVIAESLTKSLRRYEKRVSQMELNVNIEQCEINGKSKVSKVKKSVHVQVEGLVSKTNEYFSFKTHFYIAPLSY